MQKSVARNDFKKLLRKSGRKATPGRLAILELLKNARHPLSAREIIESMDREIDPVTVYRTVKTLKTNGIIKQIDLRHNHAHYELATLSEHHHLMCVRCGKIEDVHECGAGEMEATVLKHSKHFAEIKAHALEFYGVCRSCARKNEGASVQINKNAPL